MGVIVEVNNLSKQFDEVKAVDDLSFSVNDGDIYGFLGQNGAGKSTSIRMMLTLIKPSSGEIKIFGKSLVPNRHEILQKVGAIIERPDLYKYLSAYDNLAIFAKMSGIKVTRKLIMDQLDMVGLADRSSSKAKTFSQGMKQRLGIAVALVHDPALLILDEPTNGLDPQGIADMRNLILKLSHEMGKTVIVSSHLLSEIELIANRMIIIHKGKKIVEGVVSEMLDPSNTVVLLETTDKSMALTKLRELGWAATTKPSDKFIYLDINKSEIPKLVTILTSENIGIIALQPRHSLEDYFLSLTNDENDKADVEPITN
ncbi:MAG: ABC transporter ATP-binding protein [Ferruginibacter sp.]